MNRAAGIAAFLVRLVTRRRDTTNRWKAWIIAEGENRSATTVEAIE